MSRYRKGFGGLWAIIVVTMLVVASMSVLSGMHFVTIVFKLKGEVDIYLTLDDKGTESLSFLSTRLAERDYMEILGSLAAADGEKTLEANLNRIDNTLHRLGNYYLIVRNSTGDIIYEKKKGSPTDMEAYKLGSINLQWPVRGDITISSGFGFRRLDNRPDFHGGVDLAVPEGTEVYPAADGKIVRIGRGCTPARDKCEIISEEPTKYNYPECSCGYGLGNYVVIKHYTSGETFYTFYVHLRDVRGDLKEEDKVTTNTLIGFVGNTGYSEGVHLHFELGTRETKSDATTVDPCPYLPSAPVECEQPSHRVTGYEVDIPLPGGERGKVEMVIW
jgi:murein DD-endopeptidase MepM/ murein hydrolase activator NlpD